MTKLLEKAKYVSRCIQFMKFVYNEKHYAGAPSCYRQYRG
jgi:hypothetical protein